MTEHATTLRALAAEFEALVTARTHFARMADGNAHQTNMPAALAAEHRQTAVKARQEATHFEARAKACAAGADALERSPA